MGTMGIEPQSHNLHPTFMSVCKIISISISEAYVMFAIKDIRWKRQSIQQQNVNNNKTTTIKKT